MRKVFVMCIFFALCKGYAFSQAKESLFVTLSPVIMLTTDAVSAPSPVSYSLGVGYTFPLYNDFFIQCQSSFFTQYYLLDDDKAKAAEIENRTALAFCALPSVTLQWCAHESEKHYVFLGGGISIFARYGIKANGVTGVEGEVKEINKWFYSSCNFFYPHLSLSYNRIFQTIIVGAEGRVYFPVGSFMSGEAFENTLISLSIKLAKKRNSFSQRAEEDE